VRHFRPVGRPSVGSNASGHDAGRNACIYFTLFSAKIKLSEEKKPKKGRISSVKQFVFHFPA